MTSENDYISAFLNDAVTIIRKINQVQIKKMSEILQDIRKNGGRLFILGVGGEPDTHPMQ